MRITPCTPAVCEPNDHCEGDASPQSRVAAYWQPEGVRGRSAWPIHDPSQKMLRTAPADVLHSREMLQRNWSRCVRGNHPRREDESPRLGGLLCSCGSRLGCCQKQSSGGAGGSRFPCRGSAGRESLASISRWVAAPSAVRRVMTTLVARVCQCSAVGNRSDSYISSWQT